MAVQTEKRWNYFFFFFLAFAGAFLLRPLEGSGSAEGMAEADLESDHSLTIIKTTKPMETSKTTKPMTTPMEFPFTPI